MRKIRIVSAIVLLSMFIGLLPAEQVLAADEPCSLSSNEMVKRVGIRNADWAVQLYGANEVYSSMYYTGSAKTQISGYQLKVNGDKDSLDKVIHSTDMAYKAMDNGDDYVVGRSFRGGLSCTDSLWNLHPSDGSCINIDTAFIKNCLNELVAECRDESGVKYSLSEINSSESSNVYVYDFYWSTQNDVKDVVSSYDDNWIYQRVFCNYNPRYDRYFYGSMTYIQDEGDDDLLLFTGKMSQYLEVHGIVQEHGVGDSESYRELIGNVSNVLTGWLNKTETWQKVENVMGNSMGAGDSSKVEKYTGSTYTKNSVASFYIRVAADEGDLETETFSWILDPSTNQAALNAVLYNLKGCNVTRPKSALLNSYKIELKSKDDSKCTYVVKPVIRMYLSDFPCGDDEAIDDLSYSSSWKGLSTIKPLYENSFDSGKGYCDVFETEIQLLVTNYKHSRKLVEEFSITKSQIAWGKSSIKKVAEPTGNFSTLLLNAISYDTVIRDWLKPSMSSVFKEGSPIEFVTASDLRPTVYSQPYLIEGLDIVLTNVKLTAQEIDYKSDTGARVYEYMESLIKDGGIKVNYDVSSNTYFDWRNIAENKSRTLTVSNLSELFYVISYMEYLSDYSPYNSEFSHIELTMNDKTIYLLYNVGKFESIINAGALNVWLDENDNPTSVRALARKVYANVEMIVPPAITASCDSDYLCNFFIDSISGMDRDTYSRIVVRIAQAYNKLTEKGLFGESIHSYVVHKESEYILNADQILEIKESIGKAKSELMYTGTVMNCLSYAYTNLMYATLSSTHGVGEGTIEGVSDFMQFKTLMSYAYNRGDSLQGTKYSKEDGALIDYMPRLPQVSVRLSNVEQTLLYNIDYGLSVLDWSTYADENGTSEQEIRDWFKESGEAENVIKTIQSKICTQANFGTALDWAKSGVYDNVSEEYLHVFEAIINVYKVCEYLAELENSTLGDGDTKKTGEDIARSWSPAVLKFYQLYFYGKVEGEPSFFELIEQNLYNIIIDDYSYSNAIEPLGFVIRFEDQALSTQWKYGYGLSALHIPFRTNLYEISSIDLMVDDSEWITEFYYKYGFYRKALYVTTDPEATVNRYLTGNKSGTKVATLNDLLNYDRDIELYIDQGFYNGSKLEQQLDRFISNANDSSFFGSIFDACVLTPQAILKDSGYASYSSDIQKRVCPLGQEITTEEQKQAYEYDNFLLTEEEIVGERGMLSAYEYSIQQPYGVVSAIYRTQKVYDSVTRASSENPPVLVSSKNVAGLSGTDSDCYRAFYNYIILSAMEEVLESETTLLIDRDAPLFIDIFGNIVTSNGYVVIPAAANATLSGENFNPYSLGFATYLQRADASVFTGMTDRFYDYLYGIDYAYAVGRKTTSSYSPTFKESQQNLGGGYLFLKSDGTSTLGTTSLTDGTAAITVTWDYPNIHTAALKKLLLSVHFINAADTFDSTHINLIVETLRGAPIEHIDLVEEGLNSSRTMTKLDAYVAYKVEKFINSIQTSSDGTERNAKFSATLSVLDLFHIESAEKVALLVVKLALIGFLFLLAAQIVADATVGRMPLSTVVRVVVTCMLMGSCIALLPVLTEYSLGVMTKTMLQPEASELLAMQTQRESYGIEIGITDSYNTKSSTSIITRVGELDVNWYDQLLYSVYSDIDNSFTDLYNERAKTVPLAQASYTFTSGKDIYMDLTKVMNTTVLQYNAELGMLINQRAAGVTDGDCSSSYLLPYYVFLDQLVANVNAYNKTNGVQPLSFSVNSDGSIQTKDMTYAYFHSKEFLEDDYDILDLRRLFNVSSPKLSYAPIYNDEEIMAMSLSMWYPSEENLSMWTDSEISEAELEESISRLYNKAREYAINNSAMLSYVSDAAYLKSLAMYLAVEYNNIFGIGVADTFELKCVDTKDLLRYIVSTPQNVYKYANRTFARYAYETEGTLGVLCAGALYIVFCITNAIKVISYVMTYLISAASIAYHRLFKKESDYSLYGFFILIGEITILNLIYAVTFKVIMNLTRWGVPPLIAMCLAIIVQMVIIYCFVRIIFNGVKNVKNLGKTEIDALHHFFDRFAKDRHRAKGDPENASTVAEQTVATLQAHDFSRVSNDNYAGDYADVEDLRAHDRRREEGAIEAE